MKKRYKKVFSAFAACLFAASFAFSACSFGKTDPARLTNGEKKTEFSIVRTDPLPLLANRNVLSLDSLGFAVAEADSRYAIYDLTENKLVTDLQSYRPQKITDGLYYVRNADGYTLYYKGGTATYADGEIADDYFKLSDGTRIYTNANGEVVTEKDPLAPILTYENAKYALQLENYYLCPAASYAFNVFDETGTFQNAFDLYNAFRIGKEDEIQAFWMVKDTLFLQTVRVLPSDNKSYDLFFEGEKLDLNTYSYDVDDNRGKELIAFDFLVTAFEASFHDYAVLRGYTVDDRKCGQEVLQTFDDAGNIHVNLQKLLPNANGFKAEGGYVYLSDNAETVAYCDGRKKYGGEIYSRMNGYIKGQGYYTDANNLYIYDDEGELSFTVRNYYSFGAAMDGRIYYVQTETEGVDTFYTLYIYNGEPEKNKKDDRDDNHATPTVQIGAKASSLGVISDGFYIDRSGDTDKVYALSGASPQNAVLSADKNSVGIESVTVGETDYVLISYTVSGARQYSLFTVTGAYKG